MDPSASLRMTKRVKKPLYDKGHPEGRPDIVKLCSSAVNLTIRQSGLTKGLLVHESLDTHLRSLFERLVHDLYKTNLAIYRH